MSVKIGSLICFLFSTHLSLALPVSLDNNLLVSSTNGDGVQIPPDANIPTMSKVLAMLAFKNADDNERVSSMTKRICGEDDPLILILTKSGHNPKEMTPLRMAEVFRDFEEAFPRSNQMLYKKHVTYMKCRYRSIENNYI